MLVAAFKEVNGKGHGSLGSAENGLNAMDEELLIAAERAGGNTAFHTGNTDAAGKSAFGRGSGEESEKEKSRASYDAALRQMTIDQLNKVWLENNRMIAQLRGEIGDLNTEITFLNQFQEESDLYGQDGKLRDDVRDYLKKKGRDPNQMDGADILLFLQAEEVTAHGQVAEKASKIETIEQRQKRIETEFEHRGVDKPALAQETSVAVAEDALDGVSAEAKGELFVESRSDVIAQVADAGTVSETSSTFSFS